MPMIRFPNYEDHETPSKGVDVNPVTKLRDLLRGLPSLERQPKGSVSRVGRAALIAAGLAYGGAMVAPEAIPPVSSTEQEVDSSEATEEKDSIEVSNPTGDGWLTVKVEPGDTIEGLVRKEFANDPTNIGGHVRATVERNGGSKIIAGDLVEIPDGPTGKGYVEDLGPVVLNNGETGRIVLPPDN